MPLSLITLRKLGLMLLIDYLLRRVMVNVGGVTGLMWHVMVIRMVVMKMSIFLTQTNIEIMWLML